MNCFYLQLLMQPLYLISIGQIALVIMNGPSAHTAVVTAGCLPDDLR